MKRIATALLATAVLAGCGATDKRDAAVDAVSERWCALSQAEKTAWAERRDYSDDTVQWLQERCE